MTTDRMLAERHKLATEDMGGFLLRASCSCGWSIPVFFPSVTLAEARIRHGSHVDAEMNEAADAIEQGART